MSPIVLRTRIESLTTSTALPYFRLCQWKSWDAGLGLPARISYPIMSCGGHVSAGWTYALAAIAPFGAFNPVLPYNPYNPAAREVGRSIHSMMINEALKTAVETGGSAAGGRSGDH